MKKILLMLVFFSVPAWADKTAVNNAPYGLDEKKLEAILGNRLGHFYAFKDGFEYGYEPDIPDEQKKAGKLASSLVMLRFLGEKNGRYQLFEMNQARTQAVVIDCEAPCEFVRARTLAEGVEVSTEHVRRVKGSILYYAFEDAMSGKLEQFSYLKNGKKRTLWYEG